MEILSVGYGDVDGESRIPVTSGRDTSWDGEIARSPPWAFNSTLRNLLHAAHRDSTLHHIFKVLLHFKVTIAAACGGPAQ